MENKEFGGNQGTEIPVEKQIEHLKLKMEDLLRNYQDLLKAREKDPKLHVLIDQMYDRYHELERQVHALESSEK